MAEKSDKQWTDLPISFVPERLSYVPGNPERAEFNVMWREIQGMDLRQAARIMRHDGVKSSERSLEKYVASTGWTGRVVLRNKVSIVAIYLAEHLTFGEYNDVKFFWVHPEYYEHKVPLRLLQLARLELPELPTRCSVSASARMLHELLHSAGWTDLTDVTEPTNGTPRSARRDFRIGSVAGREYRAAIEAGRATR